MPRPITHYEQIPLATAKRIAQMEIRKQKLIKQGGGIVKQQRQERETNVAEIGEERGTQSMTHPVDIFRIEARGDVLWLGSAASVEEAKWRVRDADMHPSGEFLLLNQRTGDKLLLKLENLGSATSAEPVTDEFVAES